MAVGRLARRLREQDWFAALVELLVHGLAAQARTLDDRVRKLVVP